LPGIFQIRKLSAHSHYKYHLGAGETLPLFIAERENSK